MSSSFLIKRFYIYCYSARGYKEQLKGDLKLIGVGEKILYYSQNINLKWFFPFLYVVGGNTGSITSSSIWSII